MANNLSLAVAIADAAGAAPETPENVFAAAKTLTACYPESDASLSEIADAIRDQCDRSLPSGEASRLTRSRVSRAVFGDLGR